MRYPRRIRKRSLAARPVYRHLWYEASQHDPSTDTSDMKPRNTTRVPTPLILSLAARPLYRHLWYEASQHDPCTDTSDIKPRTTTRAQTPLILSLATRPVHRHLWYEASQHDPCAATPVLRAEVLNRPFKTSDMKGRFIWSLSAPWHVKIAIRAVYLRTNLIIIRNDHVNNCYFS